MSINSPPPLNASLAPPNVYECVESTSSNVIFSMYTFTHILLLVPLYVLVLFMGFQRWRHQHSTSHSDVFTYHMIAVEIFGVSGSFVYCLGIYTSNSKMLMQGVFVSSIILLGQTLFHLLTCAERYLAVVHPVTYMRLRETRGVRVRNISILCSWLLCFAWIALVCLYFPGFPFIPLICFTSVSVIVTSFCCLSVLCVLIRPGPGEVGGDRERVDQSKQRAFLIIRAIMGALLLRLVSLLVSHSLPYWQSISKEDLCALFDFAIFATLPSSSVLPLLFLHKAGKLARCRGNLESGGGGK